MSKGTYDWRKSAQAKAAAGKITPTVADFDVPEVPVGQAEAPQSDVLARLTQAVELVAASQIQIGGTITALQKQVARQEQRLDARVEVKQEARPKSRPNHPEGVRDRDGNILVRRSFESMNPFELPAEFVEEVFRENYSLEWKAESVYNMPQHTYMSKLQTNGHWTPVANSRLPGRYPGDPDEPIRHEGMILMERPMGLTLQARREDERNAQEQVVMRKRNWGVNSKNREYFDPDAPNAQQFTMLRSRVEGTDASWAPELQVASGDEL